MFTGEVLTAVQNKKPKYFYGYVIIAAGFFILAIATGSFNSYGVLFKPLVAEFDWTRSVTSGAYSLCMFTFGFLSIITGRLTDRFGPRLVVTICALLLGGGYFLLSRISTVWQLYLFFGLIVGTGQSGAFIPILSTVARWFTKRRGLATGITTAGVGVGILVIPPVASHLISIHDWRTTYIFLSIIVLIVLAVSAQFLKREPSKTGQLPDGEIEVRPDEGKVSTAEGLSLREASHTKELWIVCIVFFALVLSSVALLVHLVPLVTDAGISATTAATVLAITGGVSGIGRVVMGGVADRIGSKPALIIVFILNIVPLFWLIVARELWMLYLFAIVFGFGWGGGAVLQSPILADLFGLRSLGAILGIVQFVGTIGGTIGPVLAGKVFDMTHSYNSALLIIEAVTVIAFILALFIKTPRRPQNV